MATTGATRRRRVLFISLTPSSRARDAFPVDAGWCGEDPVRARSMLIAPLPSWSRRALPASFGRVTGIAPEALGGGTPAVKAAAILAATLAESELYSANPESDARLLARLGDATGTEIPCAVAPLDDLWAKGGREPGTLAARARSSLPAARGAGPTAARCAALTLFVRDKVFRSSVASGRVPEPMLQMDLFG